MRRASLCGMLGGASSKRHMPREGEGAVVRQGRSMALVVAFLIGCAVLLVAGASGVQAQASNKEEARCEGTRTIRPADLGGEVVSTNDIPGCPKGGLVLGTEGSDRTISRKPARPRGNAGEGGRFHHRQTRLPQGWPALGHRGIRPDPIKETCPAKFVWWGRR